LLPVRLIRNDSRMIVRNSASCERPEGACGDQAAALGAAWAETMVRFAPGRGRVTWPVSASARNRMDRRHGCVRLAFPGIGAVIRVAKQISRQTRWHEYGRAAGPVKAGLRRLTALTGPAAPHLSATKRSTVESG
jgi:hypothetical protein